MKLDEQLSKSFADAVQRSPVARKVADMCALQLLWFLFGVFACSFAWVLLVPVLAAWAVTMGLEYLVGRPRPFQEQGKKLSVGMLWVPPSFPSGHATISFSIAYLLWNMGFAAFFVYGVAVLICFGRVAVRVHYFTDVLAGAIVGTGVTMLVLQAIV